jgi:hypothetical protein
MFVTPGVGVDSWTVSVAEEEEVEGPTVATCEDATCESSDARADPEETPVEAGGWVYEALTGTDSEGDGRPRARTHRIPTAKMPISHVRNFFCSMSRLFLSRSKKKYASLEEIFRENWKIMTSRPPISLSDYHEFVPSPSPAPSPTETPRPENARRLQPAYRGAWSVGAETPLPSAPDWLDAARSAGSFYSADVKFPDSEAFEWSNLADLFDASGTLRPSRAPASGGADHTTRKPFATFDPSVYGDGFPDVGPSKIPSALGWLDSATSGVSASNSMGWSNLTDLFAK